MFLLPVVLIGLGFFAKPSGVIAKYPAQKELPATSETSQPKTIKIQIKLNSAEDLRVKKGDRLVEGDIISDRTVERTQKEVEIAALKTQLADAEKIKAASGTLPPLELPPTSYVQQEQAIAQVKSEISIQKKKIEELESVDLPEVVGEHEKAILDKLSLRKNAATADLEAAKSQRKYQEYEHARSMQLAKMEQAKSDQIFISQQAELQAKLSRLESELEAIAAVRAPFSGTVRSVKWLQQVDRSLVVEVAIAVTATTANRVRISPIPHLPLEQPTEKTFTRIISIESDAPQEEPSEPVEEQPEEDEP